MLRNPEWMKQFIFGELNRNGFKEYRRFRDIIFTKDKAIATFGTSLMYPEFAISFSSGFPTHVYQLNRDGYYDSFESVSPKRIAARIKQNIERSNYEN